MKSAIHILLVCALAAGPWGCNRADRSEESVSANADRDQAEKVEQTEPEKSTKSQRTLAPTPKRQTREAAPATERVERKTPPAERRTEPVERRAEPLERRAESEEPAPRPRAAAMENVPSGTALTVTMADAISTETSAEGDRFVAHLAKDIVVDGQVVAEKGSAITGHVKNLDDPGRVKGRARLELVLDNITVNNRKYNLDTEPFIVVASDNKERDAAIIAGGAGVGAVIGAVTGGKKGAALGAIIGGGSGTTAVLITKGDHLKIEPETRVNFVLSNDVDLPVLRRAIS